MVRRGEVLRFHSMADKSYVVEGEFRLVRKLYGTKSKDVPLTSYGL